MENSVEKEPVAVIQASDVNVNGNNVWMETLSRMCEALEGEMKRIKQMTGCEGDEGEPGMTPTVFSFVPQAAKNS